MKYTTLSRKISIFIAIIASFIIVACGGSSSGGGGTATPTPTPTASDFEFTLSNSDVVIGTNFTISVKITNNTDVTRDFKDIDIVRSADTNIATDDTAVKRLRDFQLLAGRSKDISENITAPATVDTYYYGVCLEVSGDNSKICSSSYATVNAVASDLAVTNFSTNVSSIIAGNSISLSATVNNKGGATADGRITLSYYYLTEDNSKDAINSGVKLGSDYFTDEDLASKQSKAVNQIRVVPLAVGSYYFGACVTTAGGAKDIDNSNNCTSTSQLAKVDVIIPEFEITPKSVLENAGLVEFTLRLNEAVGSTTTATYETKIFTAGAGDFAAPRGTLTIPAGSTTGTFRIFMRDDSLVEADEIIKLSFTNFQSTTGTPVNIADAIYEIVILNDDTTDFRLTTAYSGGTVDASGGVNTVEGLTRIALESISPIDRDITINYTTSGGRTYPASKGSDYTASGSITLKAGDQTVDSGIRITADNIVEADETFDIALVDNATFRNISSAGISANDLAVNTNATTITILNDDSAVFRFTGPATVDEGNSGTKPLNFQLSTTSDIADYVTFSAYFRTEGTATRNEDYEFVTNTGVLNSTNNFAYNFTVNLRGDNFPEADETIIARANINRSQRGVLYQQIQSNITTTILNDDDVTITTNIEAIPRQIVEPATPTDKKLLNFRLTASAPLINSIRLTYLLEGTAAASIDYIAPATNVVILPPYTTSINIPIEIKGDNLMESNKTLTMTLNSTSDGRISLNSSSATATILDNADDRLVVVTANRSFIRSGESVNFNVSMNRQLSTKDFFFRLIPVGVLTGKNTIQYKVIVQVDASSNPIIGLQTLVTSDVLGVRTDIKDDDIQLMMLDDTNLAIIDRTNSGGSGGDRFIKNSYFLDHHPFQPTSKSNFTVTVITRNRYFDPNEDRLFRLAVYSAAGDSRLSSIVRIIPNGNNDLDNDNIANNIDIDDDNDGLIEIHNATEFNNIRHNLAGTGYKISAGVNDNTTGAPTATNKAANYYCSTPAGLCGYELMANINLNGVNNWQPIATNNNRFTAILEGNDYTISNLMIDRQSTDYIGLFAAIEDAKIQNLRFTNVSVKGQSKVGAVVGYASSSELLNINLIGDNSQTSANAEVIGTSNSIAEVGALAGKFEDKVSIKTRKITAVENDANGNLIVVIREATSEVHDTGLIRDIASNLTVSTNSNTGSVVGGLVGNLGSPLLTSMSRGNVYGNSSIGGLVGVLSTHGLVQQSYATGNVTHNGVANSSRTNSGGLVGMVTTGKIIQSYATGRVSGLFSYNARSGGLVGSISSTTGGNVSQTYSFGDVYNDNANQIHNRNFIGHVADGGRYIAVVGNNYRKFAMRYDSDIIIDYGGMVDLELLKRLNLATTGWYAVPAGQNYLPYYSPYCDINRNGTIDEVEKLEGNFVWDFGDVQQVPVLRCVFKQPNTRGLYESQRNAAIRQNIYDSVNSQRGANFPGGGG